MGSDFISIIIIIMMMMMMNVIMIMIIITNLWHQTGIHGSFQQFIHHGVVGNFQSEEDHYHNYCF